MSTTGLLKPRRKKSHVLKYEFAALGGQTAKALPLLACKLDLVQSEHKLSQVNASARTESWPSEVASRRELKVENLLASTCHSVWPFSTRKRLWLHTIVHSICLSLARNPSKLKFCNELPEIQNWAGIQCSVCFVLQCEWFSLPNWSRLLLVFVCAVKGPILNKQKRSLWNIPLIFAW